MVVAVMIYGTFISIVKIKWNVKVDRSCWGPELRLTDQANYKYVAQGWFVNRNLDPARSGIHAYCRYNVLRLVLAEKWVVKQIFKGQRFYFCVGYSLPFITVVS